MAISPVLEHMLETAGVRVVNSTELHPGLHQAGDAGLPLVVVENRLGRAVLALQGAQVMEYAAKGRPAVLWVSPRCVLTPGKPIRAGIPLCLPWFGPGKDGAPQHGFARTSDWTLKGVETLAGGETRVVLELAGDETTSAAWPHAFRFRLDVVVGARLRLELRAENLSAETAPFGCAFHTYVAVPDVREARVSGLEGTVFIDKITLPERKVQHDEIVIRGLTDRIYLNVPAAQEIRTAAGTVRIESDTKCAVVWNAWTKDKTFADLGEGNHVGYICVERGDVADRAVTIAAGEAYACWMTLER